VRFQLGVQSGLEKELWSTHPSLHSKCGIISRNLALDICNSNVEEIYLRLATQLRFRLNPKVSSKNNFVYHNDRSINPISQAL
jgi:hypothetical protein